MSVTPTESTPPSPTPTPQAPAGPASPPAPGPVPTPPPTRPDGVSETEWAALGDPGKAAIVRERARATTAEQALAAAREVTQPPAPPKKSGSKADDDQGPDIAALIHSAVTEAIAPMQEAAAQREATVAAAAVREAVTTAARDHFHDPTDALAGVTLANLTDGAGRADPSKVAVALNDLLSRKPHLGKAVDTRRQAIPGGLVGAGGGSTAPALEDRVKAQLELMDSQH